MNFYWKLSKDYRSSTCKAGDVELSAEKYDDGSWGWIVLTPEDETYGTAPSLSEAQKSAEAEAESWQSFLDEE